MNDTASDPVRELTDSLHRLVDEFAERIGESPYALGSPALAFAIKSGLPPRMAYSVSQTASYTGFTEDQIRGAMKSGELAAIMPNGQEKGFRIPVKEVDRWIAAQL